MEWQLFEPGTIPEYCTPEWYEGRDRAPHIDEVLHRPRIEMAAQFVRDALRMGRLETVVDLGAGDGGLLSLLGDDVIAWGYDLQQTNVDGAVERGVDVLLGDVLTDDIEWGDVAVATEMIEHLVDPHALVATVRANAKVIVASSPRTETGDAHYEFHTWAWDMAGYRALLEGAGWSVWAHEPCGMFQVIMAVNTEAFGQGQIR